MNLYRIDMIQEDGSEVPLTDFLGPRLIRSRAQANVAARTAVATMQRPARLTKISGAGRTEIMGTFETSGRFAAADDD